jgi:HK97 family phage major capsid protein
MSLSRELRQQRAKLVADAQALIPTSGAMTPEIRTKFDAMMADAEVMKADIDRVERADAMSNEIRAVRPPEQSIDNRDAAAQTAELEKRAFSTYVRQGISAVKNDAELRTYTGLNIGTGNQGEFTVPTDFAKQLEIKMKAFGGILAAVPNVITTAAGNPIQLATMDDTTNKGRWLSEATAVTQTNPSFGQVTLNSWLASSDQVLVSVQLLQDSAFDFNGELSDAFAIRLNRLVNDAYTTGSGSGQPTGVVGAAGTTVTAVGDPQTGNTNDNSVGYDDLENVQFGVDAAYRTNGKYMFSDNTFKAIRKLKDSLGRPLFQTSLAEGVPDTILGKPYIVNYSMADIGSGNKSVLFGDFSKYRIRNVGGVTMFRFNEQFMSNHQIGFQAYLRTDGVCIQPAAFAVLSHP